MFYLRLNDYCIYERFASVKKIKEFLKSIKEEAKTINGLIDKASKGVYIQYAYIKNGVFVKF